MILIQCTNKDSTREVISLNGTWQIEESLAGNIVPCQFNHQIEVPGIVDMASPAFDSAGLKCNSRNYYWYYREFAIEDKYPDVVLLKIFKAKFGTKVYLNGQEVGFNTWCFTPSVFNLKPYLIEPGKSNELVIRVGAFKDNIEDTIPDGSDFEKLKYFSGIYDNVELILADYPFIKNMQIAPDINNHHIRIRVEIECNAQTDNFCFKYVINEDKSGQIVKQGLSDQTILLPDKINIIDLTIPLDDYQLWSPESPFLYNIQISTGGDTKSERFGMRSFRFDKEKKIALLNNKPYYMLGTNVCIFRFFEDPSRGDLPWDDEWVRKLHLKFKEMNWNSIRYCIGFPPEEWYNIADELGFLIHDEYPLWGATHYSSEVLATEYENWMRERWNHPCVVIWDAQNETITGETGKAINLVRQLDISNRPWDNGYSPPQSETDPIESHPYLFIRYRHNKPSEKGYMKELLDIPRIPDNDPNQHSPKEEGRYNNPIIINEYGWLWLNRDGTTTTLTDNVYANVFGDSLDSKQRLEIYAKHFGILTEYWRCHRECSAIMHFCGLGYSRAKEPRGQTSDNFVDIKNLIYESNFEKYVKPKFLPICLMADIWEKEYPRNKKIELPVYIINDSEKNWAGTIHVFINENENIIEHFQKDINISEFGNKIVFFDVITPKKPGKYQLSAMLLYENDTIESVREFIIDSK